MLDLTKDTVSMSSTEGILSVMQEETMGANFRLRRGRFFPTDMGVCDDEEEMVGREETTFDFFWDLTSLLEGILLDDGGKCDCLGLGVG